MSKIYFYKHISKYREKLDFHSDWFKEQINFPFPENWLSVTDSLIFKSLQEVNYKYLNSIFLVHKGEKQTKNYILCWKQFEYSCCREGKTFPSILLDSLRPLYVRLTKDRFSREKQTKVYWHAHCTPGTQWKDSWKIPSPTFTFCSKTQNYV